MAADRHPILVLQVLALMRYIDQHFRHADEGPLLREEVLTMGETQNRIRRCRNSMYERAIELLEAELGDEIMTLDPDAGQCFGFNSVAASVWRQLASRQAFEDLRQALLDEYEVSPEQCTVELQELMQVLVDSRTCPAGK